MRKIFLAALSALFLLPAAVQSDTLDDILNGKYRPRDVKTMTSAADGMHYYQTDPQQTAVIKYAYATGVAVDTLFSTRTARNCNFDNFEGFLVSDDENRVLVYRDREQLYRHSFKANYYYHDVRRNVVRRLSEHTSKQMIPTFSPDGKMVAYVIDNNIFLTKFDFDTESQVTKDGAQDSIINGATDWVYEEEFGTTRLMEFSPDNSQLAFVRTDESAVKEFSFRLSTSSFIPLNSFKYPKRVRPTRRWSAACLTCFPVTRTMEVPMDGDGLYPPHHLHEESRAAGIDDAEQESEQVRPLFCESPLHGGKAGAARGTNIT